LIAGVLLWRLMVYLATDRVLLLEDRLALVSVMSTFALVLFTGIYVRITAKTLRYLVDERLRSAEPLLHLTLKTQRFDPKYSLELMIENFGKGPAIRMAGTYHCRSAHAKGEWVVYDIKAMKDLIVVGSGAVVVLQLCTQDVDVLGEDDRCDGFLVVRLEYEDAMRNIYVYRFSLTLLNDGGRRYVQPFSEKLWCIPRHERYHIFDRGGRLIIEFGRKPLFERSLGIKGDDSRFGV
jgi:hypothetical protein